MLAACAPRRSRAYLKVYARIKGLARACSAVRVRPTRQSRHRCAQNADHLAHSHPFSPVFAEVVCTLGTLPPRTVTLPPPDGGNCTIRGATRRRHAEGRLLMVQNPRHYPWCNAPSLGNGAKPPPLPLVQCSLTGAVLPGGVPINAGRASPAMTGEVTSGQLRDDACYRWGSVAHQEGDAALRPSGAHGSLRHCVMHNVAPGSHQRAGGNAWSSHERVC